MLLQISIYYFFYLVLAFFFSLLSLLLLSLLFHISVVLFCFLFVLFFCGKSHRLSSVFLFRIYNPKIIINLNCEIHLDTGTFARVLS